MPRSWRSMQSQDGQRSEQPRGSLSAEAWQSYLDKEREGQRGPEGGVKPAYPSATRFSLGMSTPTPPSSYLSKVGGKLFEKFGGNFKRIRKWLVGPIALSTFDRDVAMIFWLPIFGESAIVSEKDMHHICGESAWCWIFVKVPGVPHFKKKMRGTLNIYKVTV